MAGKPTVALHGRIVGPDVTDNGGLPQDDVYSYTLTLASGDVVLVTWRDICWIDAYPHHPGDTPEGRKRKDLGQRTIWLGSDKDPAAPFLTGALTEVTETTDMTSLEAWKGPEHGYGPGPAGTTYPPCLCGW